jgi:hypothetical protein
MKYKSSLNKEFQRFWIKLIFCFLLILFLMYTNFYWALGFLVVLLGTATLAYKFFKKSNSKFVQFIFQAEHEYEESFPGKEAMISLLGFITVFVVIWALHYFIAFNPNKALIIGLISVGCANSLATLILWRAKHQYVIYGTTMEFLILSTLICFGLFMVLGLPYYIALFLAFGANLFSLLPLDHNFTNLFASSLLFMLLFV